MITRYVGASPGLLAITIVVTARLFARHPVTIPLSRGIHVILLICLIGLMRGRVAPVAKAAHGHKRDTEIRKRFHGIPAWTVGDGLENGSTDIDDGSIAS